MTTAYRRRTALKGERGYVLIMSALLMLPLLAFAGFAVDIGSWYMYANRMQRAADAAALAGVVWMPNDEKAETIALETAKANGFDDAASDIVVTVTPVGNRRLRVNITDTRVDMYFSKIFISAVDIQRQSLAEYVQAVPMGSPDNTLGNDPDRWGTAGYSPPYYVLNVASPLGTKVNGDRFTAGTCGSGVSGCSGSTNLDYADYGYFFKVTVDARPASGDLNIQAFDPALTVVGTTCGSSNLPQAGSTWNTQAAALVSAGTVPSDAANRYVRGQTHPQYCVADDTVGGWDMDTSYIVREPDNTPFDNFDNPIVCAKTFGSYNENVVTLLQSSTVRTPENMTFAQHFRRWTTMCTIPWNEVLVGDYLLQITSTADQSSPPDSLADPDPDVNTGGYNKYMLRAGWGTNPAAAGWNTGVNLFADGRLPIYVNQSDSTISSTFYLARIVPEYAGQMLEIELFDIGDGSNTAVDLTILPPPDMTGSGLGTCTFILDGGSTTTSATCKVNGLTSSTDQGKLRTVQIPLPDDYGCDAGSDFGCWFKIDIDFNGSNPTDQTTWSARVRGDPVRIVE
jgi:Flp pilus assembly protein TadG